MCESQFLGAYQDAKVGFGTAYNIKTSITRSLYECPFLAVGVKVGTMWNFLHFFLFIISFHNGSLAPILISLV